jgi:hypothetical protein
VCGKRHEYTQCPTCGQWSDHDEWYHDDDDLSVEEYIANPERLRKPIIVPLQED